MNNLDKLSNIGSIQDNNKRYTFKLIKSIQDRRDTIQGMAANGILGEYHKVDEDSFIEKYVMQLNSMGFKDKVFYNGEDNDFMKASVFFKDGDIFIDYIYFPEKENIDALTGFKVKLKSEDITAYIKCISEETSDKSVSINMYDIEKIIGYTL